MLRVGPSGGKAAGTHYRIKRMNGAPFAVV
jgi:hypothetical protein